MIENYDLTEEGIIKQINCKKFDYNYSYSDNYNTPEYQKNSHILNTLRLDFSISSFQKKVPNSILDVGYGNGDFLKIAKSKISNCYGYDISDYSVPENCRKVHNLFELEFDVVTFWDSLEHFEKIEFVKDLNCKIICITVPWCHWKSDNDDEWFKNWKHRKPNEHLWHFNPISLTKFMEKQGYQNIFNYSSIEDIVRYRTNENLQNTYTSSWKKLNK